MTNKILPVALVAALLGGSVGAFVMRPSKNVEATPTLASNLATAPAQNRTHNLVAEQPLQTTDEQASLDNEQLEAYRQGFVDGAKTVRENAIAGTTEQRVVTQTRTAPATRVVYRDRTRSTRSSSRARSSQQVYYDYNQPRKRSFWQRHRDKLTVAMGTGAGAAIGGLAGGKKGALIGALAGAGGSALYTYKLRKRDRNY